MIPAGYMSKKIVVRPDWLKADSVDDVCAVSGCISEPFADYIKYWKHNGFGLFNSISDIEHLCNQEKIDASHNTLFYYEMFENEYEEDSKEWSAFEPEVSFETHVQEPLNAKLVGYDVMTFTVGTSPECSPLSCNSLATEIPVNRHCLFDTFEQAIEALEAGKFDSSEPGKHGIGYQPNGPGPLLCWQWSCCHSPIMRRNRTPAMGCGPLKYDGSNGSIFTVGVGPGGGRSA